MTADRSSALEGLLTIIDAAIAAAKPRDIAALSREKRQVLAEVQSLAALPKGSPIDDLGRRRTARRAKAAARAPAATGGQQRRKRSG